jgi:invasion protein IalB
LQTFKGPANGVGYQRDDQHQIVSRFNVSPKIRTGATFDFCNTICQKLTFRRQAETTHAAEKADPLRLTVVLPVNVTFSNAPSFSADGKAPEPLDFGWRKCLPGGCIADALPTDEVLHRWKSQANAERITWTGTAGHDLAIGLSFRGLSQALDALSKEL